MKVCFIVTETRYGYVEVDVPKDSPILDPDASLLKKRKAAKQLGEKALTSSDACIVWPDPEENDFYTPALHVVNYEILDEEEQEALN